MRFTVRRPPSGEVSPCCHRPSGGDVACSIDVGVALSSVAGLALEDRLALAVLGCDVPAFGTALRRVCGQDLLDPAKSLVLQTCGEEPPTVLADRAVKSTLLGDSRARLFDGAARGARHRPHVKGFDSDHVEAPREVSRRFLDPVLTSVPLTGSQLGDRPFRLSATVGAWLGPGEPPLQYLQPLRFARRQIRGTQQFAGGQGGRHSNAAVNSDHTPVARPGDRVWNVCERDMPAAGPISRYPVGLDTDWHRARQPKPHPPHLGNPDPTETTVQLLDVMRSQADLSKPLVHTGFTPCRATMRAVKEVLHRLCEISQRLLLRRLTPSTKPRILGPCLGQLRSLFQIAGSLAPRLPMPLLLHRQIPDVPRIPAMSQQLLLLLRSRHQSEPRHSRTITTDTDSPRRCTPAHLVTGSLTAPKSGAFSARRLR